MIKLTEIEFDLLGQLSTDERQISENHSHREMYRLVEAGYVKATSMNPDSVLYAILPRGQQALEQQSGSPHVALDLLHRLRRIDRKTIADPAQRFHARRRRSAPTAFEMDVSHSD